MYAKHLDQIAINFRNVRKNGGDGKDQLNRAAEIGWDIYRDRGNKGLRDVSLEVTEETEMFLNHAWDGIGDWIS